MKTPIKLFRNQKRRDTGFALIVTLVLMVLLTVIAVGLLSISSVALRSSQQGEANATARSNARMALMMAIGELQLHTGSDTRITARADILDENNPPVMGAWASWEGQDRETNGRPRSPGNYETEKANRFLKWLVSEDSPGVPDTTAGADKVTLVGAGSVGTDADRVSSQIHLNPTKSVSSGREGAYAWWVGGENIKARLKKPSMPASNADDGQWASAMKSNSTADPEVFDLNEALLTTNDPNSPDPVDKLVSLEQVNLIEEMTPLVSEEYFHDLSVTSTGLLTNAATGGWKKDLSLFTENSAQNSGPIGIRDLPLFRLTPEEDSLTTLPQGSDVRGTNSVFYPWSDYRGNAGDHPIYQHAAVASWNNLMDYALLYKETGNGTSIAPNSYIWQNTEGTTFNFLHEVRVLPVIARIQWVHSHFAKRVGVGTAAQFQPCMVLTPVITMWNPYNLSITMPDGGLRFDVRKPVPTAFDYNFGTGDESNVYLPLISDDRADDPEPGEPTSTSIAGKTFLRYRVRDAFTLQPGETRVFAPDVRREGNNSNVLDLKPGYNPGQGHVFPIVDENGNPIFRPGNDTINVNVSFDSTYIDGGKTGVGVYLDMFRGQTGRPHLVYRMVYTPDVAKQIYPTNATMAASKELSGLTGAPTPFLTTIFGARMASQTHLSSKGLLQSSPLVNYTAMGEKDEAESTIRRNYRGSDHPVNSPFDYSFEVLTVNDSVLPDADPVTNRGYIVTGFKVGTGLSRCVMAEIPTRPLQSIAELQHWDLRYENPLPPFAFNLIGNSNATPLIAPNSVYGQYDDAVNLQYDDSYCANHVLFDDWFLSSIAPDPANFGTSGREMENVFSDFIDGTDLLPNAAYRPIALDAGGDADEIFAQHVDTADSWKTIASRLEVEGMFNVNSTSVTAWRALLRHARDQRIPFINSSGTGSSSIDLSDSTDHAVSRFSVSGDSDTSEQGTSGFDGANEFTGYRTLDGSSSYPSSTSIDNPIVIDILAEKIVEQVRERGPFLSLSEFVNRQLSSDEDLAIAGAIQSALDEISDDLYDGIIDTINRPATGTNPGGRDAEYLFERAAEGQATFGLPGWTRQADVLRPIAPILTVRDDTFTIRAYGDARDNTGTNVIAKAVCEAVVRRTRDYVDPADPADLETYPTSTQNQTFGRRYEIVSFRWLSPSEI